MSRHPYRNVKFRGQALQWKTVVKHLGNFISSDLKEDKEINEKRKDLISSTNGTLCTFGHIDKNILSRVFNSQCCHFYGCEAWSLSDRSLQMFFVAWRKACRRIWSLPNISRSRLLPFLVNSPSADVIIKRRFANMYNTMISSQNQRLGNLCRNSLHQP